MTTYYCPECDRQASMPENHDNNKNGEVQECANCGSEDVHQGTKEDYQEEQDGDQSFQEELENDVEGVGPSRAEDITQHYSSWESLMDALESEETPLTEKTEDLLRTHLESEA